jgi:cyclic beta-1,2-glucan synthetase
VVSARDLGWTGTIDAIERLEATLSTMNRLARFRGHFYNWYDTRDLRPLAPQYISSVDSGNLAGHLIALANACREWALQPLTDQRRLAGVADALELMREEAGRLRDGHRTQTVTWRQLDDALALAADAGRATVDGEGIAKRLSALAVAAETLVDIARALASERSDGTGADMVFWAETTLNAIESHGRDFSAVFRYIHIS